ncbi:hypothetical protein MIMGU_mgv1a017175mg [Erythranthe guttata]|uniref:Uncharacterized protein n=1 Tax=Erythranthe guttata TaxID=4155 RepID=A0A022PZW6_ERYGU|nr:hypothetical protein MIMGU_mgv1a017175mg [Erythranthe guttata]
MNGVSRDNPINPTNSITFRLLCVKHLASSGVTSGNGVLCTNCQRRINKLMTNKRNTKQTNKLRKKKVKICVPELILEGGGRIVSRLTVTV